MSGRIERASTILFFGRERVLCEPAPAVLHYLMSLSDDPCAPRRRVGFMPHRGTAAVRGYFFEAS